MSDCVLRVSCFDSRITCCKLQAASCPTPVAMRAFTLIALALVLNAHRAQILGLEDHFEEVVLTRILLAIELERLPAGQPGRLPLDDERFVRVPMEPSSLR